MKKSKTKLEKDINSAFSYLREIRLIGQLSDLMITTRNLRYSLGGPILKHLIYQVYEIYPFVLRHTLHSRLWNILFRLYPGSGVISQSTLIRRADTSNISKWPCIWTIAMWDIFFWENCFLSV
jgi:hypothetical protein